MGALGKRSGVRTKASTAFKFEFFRLIASMISVLLRVDINLEELATNMVHLDLGANFSLISNLTDRN